MYLLRLKNYILDVMHVLFRIMSLIVIVITLFFTLVISIINIKIRLFYINRKYNQCKKYNKNKKHYFEGHFLTKNEYKVSLKVQFLTNEEGHINSFEIIHSIHINKFFSPTFFKKKSNFN